MKAIRDYIIDGEVPDFEDPEVMEEIRHRTSIQELSAVYVLSPKPEENSNDRH